MSSKRTKKTTLVMLIDAFSKVYLSKKYVPFLYDLAQDGVSRQIEPLFAFKGIETTIFTGVWPNVHNVWTEFCLANNRTRRNNKERLLQEIVRTVDFLPNDKIRARLRYAIERYVFHKPSTAPNLIPPAAMPYFQPSQRRKITEPEAVSNTRTIFDVFREKRLRFVFIEPWIWGDWRVVSRAKKLMSHDRKFHFWYLKFNRLDHLGHKFGPAPSAFKEELNKIDKYAEDIITLLRRKTQNPNVLVLADHGMSKVHRTINMLENLDRLRSKMYEDFIAFVDSTMIRFWFFTRKAKQEICEHLQQTNCGHILTSSEKNLLKIPSDPKYGETIYVVDEGYVLHPCFFHSESMVNGMHGYAYSEALEATPIAILNGGITENLQMSEQITYADMAQSILRSSLPD